MFAYHNELRSYFSQITIQKDVFQFLTFWRQWILTTPRDPVTLWPIRSIVVQADLEAKSREGCFTFSRKIPHIMRVCNDIYQICSLQTHKKIHTISKNHTNVSSLSGCSDYLKAKSRKFTLGLSRLQQERFNELLETTDPYVIRSIIGFYTILQTRTDHVSVPPFAIRSLRNVIEIFGSPFTTVGNYCSPLSIEKKFCKSLGSAFDVLADYAFPEDSTLLVHPPLYANMINEACDLIVHNTLQRCPKIQVLVLLPCWDNELQEKIGFPNYHTPQIGYQMLQHSEFHFQTILLEKTSFPYYDYFTDQPHISAYTVLTILTNKKEESERDNLMVLIHTFLTTWSKLAHDEDRNTLYFRQEPEPQAPSSSLK